MVVATANGAGYRYGVSDQAFYIPVVVRALDPGAYPRDAALIDAQGALMLSDEALAGVVRATGWSLDWVFLGAYLLATLLVWSGLTLIGARVYRHAWTTTALVAAFALRHRITRTSANSLEPYFHPRMLAFGLGLLALAALLRRRTVLSVGLVAGAAAVHVTTGLWFAVLIGVAIVILDCRWRTALLAARRPLGWPWRDGRSPPDCCAAGSARWTRCGCRPSRARTRSSRRSGRRRRGRPISDSLRSCGWRTPTAAGRDARHPRTRRSSGAPRRWPPCSSSTLPAVTAGVALFVQLQIPRVFWLVDVVATIYALGAVAETARATPKRAAVFAMVLSAVAIGRGAFIMLVERPERALFAVHLPDDAWHDASTWLSRQGRDTHVLADPGHGWKFGTSVRVAGELDVFLEEVKDSALAIYSRDVAARVVERTSAVGDFAALTAERARELAVRYDLDYLVTVGVMPLPEVYRNGQFRVYSLSGAP